MLFRFPLFFRAGRCFPFPAVFFSGKWFFRKTMLLLIYRCKEEMPSEGRIIKERKKGNAQKRIRFFSRRFFPGCSVRFLILHLMQKNMILMQICIYRYFSRLSKGFRFRRIFFSENGNGDHAILHCREKGERISRILFLPL